MLSMDLPRSHCGMFWIVGEGRGEYGDRGVARISVWGGTGRAPKARENRGAEVCPLPRNFAIKQKFTRNFCLNFYIKMVSSGAFPVAISYRLAACFTRIGSTCVIEIYWRSFRHFWNYNYFLRKIAGKKWQKCAKIDKKKLAQKLRCFCTFPYLFAYNFLQVVNWGARPPVAPSPVYASVWGSWYPHFWMKVTNLVSHPVLDSVNEL